MSAVVLGGKNIAKMLPSLLHSSSADGCPGQLSNNNKAFGGTFLLKRCLRTVGTNSF